MVIVKIGIGNDHTALALKTIIIEHLKQKRYEIVDFGTNLSEVTDYPIYGEKVAKALVRTEIDFGILICGTGIGISLAANKVKGVRAAVCSEPYSAAMAKRHNNANIIAFGARVVGSEMAKMIVDSWLDVEFEHGIHEKRVNMLMRLENNE